MMASSYAGLSRSNIAQQSSKGSLFTSFEDVEVTITSSVIIVAIRSTQPCILPYSECQTGWNKGGNVRPTSAGRQMTLCDPI